MPADLALLFMRLLVGAVFVTSGWSHAKDPVTRGKSIGQSPGFTRFLGIAELAGGLGVAFGVLPRCAALGLILIMLGAVQKKIFSLEDRILGRAQRWVALRAAVRRHVSRHRDDRTRSIRALGLDAAALTSEPTGCGSRAVV